MHFNARECTSKKARKQCADQDQSKHLSVPCSSSTGIDTDEANGRQPLTSRRRMNRRAALVLQHRSPVGGLIPRLSAGSAFALGAAHRNPPRSAPHRAPRCGDVARRSAALRCAALHCTAENVSPLEPLPESWLRNKLLKRLRARVQNACLRFR